MLELSAEFGIPIIEDDPYSLTTLLGNKTEFLVQKGGIHMWCKLNDSINEYQLLEESVKRGAAFIPGSIFGTEKGYVRFTFGRENNRAIRDGISRFAEELNNIR